MMRHFALLFILLGAPAWAPAQANTVWTNFTATGNSWTNASNWTVGVPTATATALVNSGSATANYTALVESTDATAARLQISAPTSRTATVNIASGAVLSVVGDNADVNLGGNSIQIGSRGVLSVAGTLTNSRNTYLDGGVLRVIGGTVWNTNAAVGTSRAANRSIVEIAGGGGLWSGRQFDAGGVAGDNSFIRVLDGWMRVPGMNAGNRGTGTIIIGSSGTLTNTGALTLSPFSADAAVTVGYLYSTGNVVNAGNFYIGRQNSNANSFGAAVISGGTFLQQGTSATTTDVGREGRGSLTVEGGAFVSTNSMNVGLLDTQANRIGRGDGTVLVTGTGALAVTNLAKTATITIGSGTVAVPDTDRAIGRITVGGGSLTTDRLIVRNGAFTNSGGTSTIGSLIASNATASVAFSAGTLNLGGSIISNGQALVVGDGSQTATLNLTGNGTHLLADGLLVASNSMLLGVGNIAGNITNFGTIAPGISPGIISVSGDAVLAASSLMAMELAGTNATEFDQFNVGGMLGFEGTLTVTLTNGFNPQVGDTFDLFDFGSTNGLTFDQLNLPTLVNALWDTSDLYVGGSIAVVIPEPATFMLLGIGTALLLASQKKRFPK